MTAAVAESPQAVKRALTKEQVLEFVAEPLKQLPADWRLPAWDFWAFFSNLLTNQLALCTRLRWWLDNDGLTLAEAQLAFDRIRSTERAGAWQFASQVLAGLADEIQAIRRESREADRKRRERADEKPFTADALAAQLSAWQAGGGKDRHR